MSTKLQTSRLSRSSVFQVLILHNTCPRQRQIWCRFVGLLFARCVRRILVRCVLLVVCVTVAVVSLSKTFLIVVGKCVFARPRTVIRIKVSTIESLSCLLIPPSSTICKSYALTSTRISMRSTKERVISRPFRVVTQLVEIKVSSSRSRKALSKNMVVSTMTLVSLLCLTVFIVMMSVMTWLAWKPMESRGFSNQKQVRRVRVLPFTLKLQVL
mmetsp:Transcript_6518/g.13180  ORF Transcript_6518/g.13180 Transcript_6518/m.13180 type:complete len:213 (+) Transcript_6518:1059-1697(+)